MRILATVHLDRRLRAYGRANGAARAFLAAHADRGQISVAVQFGRQGNDLLGAEEHAELAAFAEFTEYVYLSFHAGHPKRVMNFRER
jgi:hypothetical protein